MSRFFGRCTLPGYPLKTAGIRLKLALPLMYRETADFQAVRERESGAVLPDTGVADHTASARAPAIARAIASSVAVVAIELGHDRPRYIA